MIGIYEFLPSWVARQVGAGRIVPEQLHETLCNDDLQTIQVSQQLASWAFFKLGISGALRTRETRGRTTVTSLEDAYFYATGKTMPEGCTATDIVERLSIHKVGDDKVVYLTINDERQHSVKEFIAKLMNAYVSFYGESGVLDSRLFTRYVQAEQEPA